MSDQAIFLAAAIGLVVNTLAILGVAWGGGRLLGKLETAMETLAVEVKGLRESKHEHGNILQRIVATLDDLERRISTLETREERRRR